MLELLSLQLGVFKAHLSALLLKYKDVAGGQAKHGAFPTLAQSRLPHLLIPAPTDPSPWDRLFSSGAAAAPRAFRAPVEQGVTARGQNGEFGPQTPGFSHHFHAVLLYLQVLSLHSCSAWAEVVEQCLLIPFLSFSAQCQSWWGSGGECHTRALSRGCLWPGRDSGKHLNQEFRCWPGTDREPGTDLCSLSWGPHTFVFLGVKYSVEPLGAAALGIELISSLLSKEMWCLNT